MKKAMARITIILFVMCVVCTATYNLTNISFLETMAISFGVTFYHFIMRLSVGYFWDGILNNQVNYMRGWFRVSPFEMKIYKILRVKSWKNHMPTFEKDYFDIKTHSLKEIIGATCQAEIVHETIVLLSFLPIIISKWFGSCAVFIITSIIAALIDAAFVIMQRFNRFRLLKIIKR